MSTLKIEHISHLDNGTPDLSIDSSGHLNIVNGNLQMGGVTMLNTSTGAPLPLSGGAITGELIIADTGTLDIRMGTDKRVTWSGALGEIGSVAGFQATNTAGSALSSFGMRGTDLRFATGSAERLRITDSAVGIGTDSPSTTASGYNGGTLHVHNTGTGSSIRLTNNTTGTSTTSGMLISKWSDSKTYFTNFDNGADTIFTQSNSSGGLVTTLALDGDGNVGIGTTGPEVKLEVNGGADDSVVFGGRSDGGNGNNRRFNLIAYADGGGANYGGGLKIQTRDSVNVFHDRITVQSNGYVGIGNNDPQAILDVSGDIKLSGSVYGGRNEGAIADYTVFGIDTSNSPSADFYNTYTSGNGDQAGLGFIQGQFLNSPVIYMYGTTTTHGNSFTVGRLTSTGANPGGSNTLEPLLVVKQDGNVRMGGGRSIREDLSNQGLGGVTAWNARNRYGTSHEDVAATVSSNDFISANGSFSSPRFYTGKEGVGRALFLSPVTNADSRYNGAFWSGFITHDNYTQPAALEFHIHVGYNNATSPNYYYFEKRGGSGSYTFCRLDNPDDSNNQWYAIVANGEFNKGWMVSGHGNRMAFCVVDSTASRTNQTDFKTV